MRLSPLLLGSAAICSLLAGGCGDGSDDQAKIEQARREGAAAAHQAEEIHQLREQVSSLRRERGEPASVGSTSTPPSTAPSPAEEPGKAGDLRIPVSGTYSGQAAQRGSPARLDKDYPLEMTFSSSGSYVTYPTLGCNGSLLPIGFAGEYRVYEEEIASGHCDSGGTWHVRVDSPTSLEASWSLPSASYTVSATLER